MPADVTLVGEQVVLEGWDLVLRSEDRQGPAPGEHRRALVHDRGDKLTVNWGHDYSGGINLVGVRRISGYAPQGIIALDRDTIEVDGIVQGARITVNWETYELTADGVSGAFWMPIPEGEDTVLDLADLCSVFASRLVECARRILDLDGRLTEAQVTIDAQQQRLDQAETGLAGAMNRITQLLDRVQALEAQVGTP